MIRSVDLPRVSTTATPLVGSILDQTRSYIAFIWLGLGSLLPFNFFITADPYYRCKFEDRPLSNTTFIHLDFLYENTVTLCASLTYLITMILVTFKFVPYIYKYRIYISYIIIIICFIISLTLALLSEKTWREIFFILTMILVMIQSICSAILLNCFFSLASTLPTRYIQGYISGQSLGGIFVVLCSIISISVSTRQHVSTAVYFLLAIFVIISNMIVYFYLEKTHLFQIYSSAVQEINNEHEPLFHETSSNNYDDNDHSMISSLGIRQRLFLTYKQIKWNFLGVFLTFILTFSIFPGSLSKIKSMNQLSNQPTRLWPDRLFVQVMTFLIFFIGDTFGRIISSKIHIPSINFPRCLFLLCLSRFIFLVLFAFCNFRKENVYPHIFNHDAIYGVLVLIFSISHGYCNSLNMIYAPQRVSAKLSGTVGALMMMALALGTFVGSILSYGVVFVYGANRLSGGQHC